MYTLEIMLENMRNVEKNEKNTAEKVRPNHLRDAPATLTACLVVLTTGSQGFAPAAKRLSVLLLASRVRRGRRGVDRIPSRSCCEMGDIVINNTAARKCDRITSGTPPRCVRLTSWCQLIWFQGFAPAAKRLAVLLLVVR